MGAQRLARVKPQVRCVEPAGGHESAGETPYGSAERDKPLEGKPWTWLRGETNPRRLEAEQTLVVVRNGEEGT